ncbi:hypothetical protein EVAR_13460_1 [Eumeta japonica]|uniref:Uncharacterized protein n=1 Tax=Eumeta variegata TaxID=151549 RepID=A0A4C1UXX1_EUMVA|nr:hypothetical protein EVAR_13460_1 [Eumeta japonica]
MSSSESDLLLMFSHVSVIWDMSENLELLATKRLNKWRGESAVVIAVKILESKSSPVFPMKTLNALVVQTAGSAGRMRLTAPQF